MLETVIVSNEVKMVASKNDICSGAEEKANIFFYFNFDLYFLKNFDDIHMK